MMTTTTTKKEIHEEMAHKCVLTHPAKMSMEY